MKGRIWLIGGTSESARIAKAIASKKFPCTITVTTETAKSLYPRLPHLRVRVGQLNYAQMRVFCSQEQIVAVVDASHPYAVVISQMAIAAAKERQIPYLRYERPQLENSLTSAPSIIELDSFDTLLSGDYLLGERVLLTIGYKTLPLFQPWQNQSTLFARILPSVNSLEVAIKAGFTPERIIALRPPISSELEKALWCQWQISLVVTKASGKAGGEEVKRCVAKELGIPLIVIARPKIVYPQQTRELDKMLEFCRQHLCKI
ncbi:MAG: cobalt-precorrin-6A reductase [Moorea sp. SIO2B7]|nr:cobalt-precorrin-6A reductase [Moorena sp. SIO2B7]